MSSYPGPGRQVMVSRSQPDSTDAQKKYDGCLLTLGASDPTDITIGDFKNVGNDAHYTLTWNTYLGWRVYMLMYGLVTPDTE